MRFSSVATYTSNKQLGGSKETTRRYVDKTKPELHKPQTPQVPLEKQCSHKSLLRHRPVDYRTLSRARMKLGPTSC